MRWAVHAARMGERRNAYMILVEKPEGKRPLGKTTHRWACYRDKFAIFHLTAPQRFELNIPRISVPSVTSEPSNTISLQYLFYLKRRVD
jgi:hypothetical protein